MQWTIALIGFGQVGRALARILLDKQAEILARRNAGFRVIAICTGRSGNYYAAQGLPLSELLTAERDSPVWQRHRCSRSVSQLIAERAAGIYCDLSPTDLVSAEPSLSWSRQILQAGLHLVTANKGPSALAGEELDRTAAQNACGFYQEATVMSGSPVFSFIDEALPHCRFLSFRGAVNGSTNFILSRMEGGSSFETALASAREQGYTEADPSLDIDGWDSAAKAVILTRRLFGIAIRPQQLPRRGIRDFPRSWIERAQADQACIRLISRGRLEGDRLELEVGPESIGRHDPLSRADGSVSVLTLSSDLLGELTLTGPGAGGRQTAAGVLSDLLRIDRNYSPI